MSSRAWSGRFVLAVAVVATLCLAVERGSSVAAKDQGAPAAAANPVAATADSADERSTPAVADEKPAQPVEQPALVKVNASKKKSRAEASKTGKKKDAKPKGKGQGAKGTGDSDDAPGPDPEVVTQVMAVQDRNSGNLMAQKGIAGTATALDDDGNVVIRVYTTGADNPQIPKLIENIPVQVVLTGPIHPWQKAKKPPAAPAGPKAAPPAPKTPAPKTQLPPPPPAPVLLPVPPDPVFPLFPPTGSASGSSSESLSKSPSASPPPPLSKPQPPPQPAPPPAPTRQPPAQDRRALNTRPVPIGVSSMADISCAAATLGCRVKDSNGNFYALSCNHVYALSNQGQNGVTPASQPSSLDDGCQIVHANDIGTLFNFVKIDFSGGENTVDCAIVKTTTSLVGNATPSDGYGTPKSSTVAASLGQKLQKYGRTSGYTTGTVNGVNVTVQVGYDTGNALFVGQIEVQGTGGAPSLGQPGDSGSLVVDSQGHPVGLLFAGGGGLTFLNPIASVLKALAVTIDGN